MRYTHSNKFLLIVGRVSLLIYRIINNIIWFATLYLKSGSEIPTSYCTLAYLISSVHNSTLGPRLFKYFSIISHSIKGCITGWSDTRFYLRAQTLDCWVCAIFSSSKSIPVEYRLTHDKWIHSTVSCRGLLWDKMQHCFMTYPLMYSVNSCYNT